MTADLFCVVFKPTEEDAALSKNASLGDNKEIHNAISIQAKKAERVKSLANAFAAMVLEFTFSPTEILSFLMGYRQSPDDAINNVEI